MILSILEEKVERIVRDIFSIFFCASVV